MGVCMCAVCHTHKEKERMLRNRKAGHVLLGRVWGTVSGPFPQRGLWGGRKSAGFGGREGRFKFLPTHLVLCDFRGVTCPRCASSVTWR